MLHMHFRVFKNYNVFICLYIRKNIIVKSMTLTKILTVYSIETTLENQTKLPDYSFPKSAPDGSNREKSMDPGRSYILDGCPLEHLKSRDLN